ncbi:MAG: heavy metal-binding domain-containing protein [Burkholderiales bacterium]|nr:heavy metal-binding domain-containing protein [Phycisphaerae bacterium]
MALAYHGQGAPIAHHMVTTAFELPGFRVVRNVGLVRGVVVRSRSVVGNWVSGLQTIVGGNIPGWAAMCEQAREDSYQTMLSHAVELGANALIGVRYDANDIRDGVTEVLAYGTAVVVEPIT